MIISCFVFKSRKFSTVKFHCAILDEISIHTHPVAKRLLEILREIKPN